MHISAVRPTTTYELNNSEANSNQVTKTKKKQKTEFNNECKVKYINTYNKLTNKYTTIATNKNKN